MAKQPKKITLAEKSLMTKLVEGGRVGVGENHTADKLMARGMIKYFGQGKYRLTDEGKKYVLDT